MLQFIKQLEMNTTRCPGLGTIFYLLTPPGVTVCLTQAKPGPTRTARTQRHPDRNLAL